MDLTFPQRVAQAGVISCIIDAVAAPKPGNVHRFADARDTTPIHFLVSATALFPSLALVCEHGMRISQECERFCDAKLGFRILEAIEARRSLGVASNTNLGIVLLFIPLAAAAGAIQAQKEAGIQKMRVLLSDSVKSFLEESTPEDCMAVASAISTAAPAGLGSSEMFDIRSAYLREELEREKASLRSFFAPSRDTDSIAEAYSTGFKLVIDFFGRRFDELLSESKCAEKAFLQLYLEILARLPDSHIRRTRGPEAAERVRRRAADLLELGGVSTAEGEAALWTMDRELHQTKINPGTTADLTAASMFCAGIQSLVQKGDWSLAFCSGTGGIYHCGEDPLK